MLIVYNIRVYKLGDFELPFFRLDCEKLSRSVKLFTIISYYANFPLLEYAYTRDSFIRKTCSSTFSFRTFNL